MELAEIVNVSAAAPIGSSITTVDQYVGMRLTSISMNPNAKQADSSSLVRGTALRRVDISAPPSEPTAIAVVNRP